MSATESSTPQEPANFKTLPNEMFSDIMVYLMLEGRPITSTSCTRGIASICRTCKQFNNNSTGFLYRKSSRPYMFKTSFADERMRCERLPPRIHGLVQTLCEKPYLKRKVRSVHIQNFENKPSLTRLHMFRRYPRSWDKLSAVASD